MKKQIVLLCLMLLAVSLGFSQVLAPSARSEITDRHALFLGFRVPQVNALPVKPDLRNYTGDSASGAMVFCKCAAEPAKRGYYGWDLNHWERIDSIGAQVDTTSLSNRINLKVDSVTTSADSTNLYYWINGTSFHIVNLAYGVTGGDTTIYETVLDSTGNPYRQVIVAGPNGKLKGYPEFIYDETNGILRVQRISGYSVFEPGLIVDGAIHTNTLKSFVEIEMFNSVKMPEVGYLPLYYKTDTLGVKFAVVSESDGQIKRMDFKTVLDLAGGGGITELTGPITAGPGSGSQATTVTPNAITDAMLRQGAALSVVGRPNNTPGNVTDITASSKSLLGSNTATLAFLNPDSSYLSTSGNGFHSRDYNDLRYQGVLPTGTTGGFAYWNGSAWVYLAPGAANQHLTGGSVPVWRDTTTGGSSGTVTSVDGSGGSTGLTLTGGPITGIGTLTLGGTLGIANGGTGQITANAGLNALLPSQTGNSGLTLVSDGANTSWGTGNNIYTINGALTGPRTLTGSASNTMTWDFSNLAATQTNGVGLWLKNSTAATVSLQQWSPSIVLEGQGWTTPATASSKPFRIGIYNTPVSSGHSGEGSFIVAGSRNSAAYENMIETFIGAPSLTTPYTRLHGGSGSPINIFRNGSGAASLHVGNQAPTLGANNSLGFGLNITPALNTVVVGIGTNGQASSASTMIGNSIIPNPASTVPASANNLYAGYSIGPSILSTNNSVILGVSPVPLVTNYPNTFTITAGTGYTAGTYNNVTLTASAGQQNMIANITVSGGGVTSVVYVSGGGYARTNISWTTANTNIGGTGTGFSVRPATIFQGGTNLTVVGYGAAPSLTYGANAVVIGSGADIPAAGTVDNQLSIQNIIYGLDNSGTGPTASTGRIGIGTKSPDASARLHVDATDKGFLIPRVTNAQMQAIPSPATGLQVYTTTDNAIMVFDGTNWTGFRYNNGTGKFQGGFVVAGGGSTIAWTDLH